MWLIGWCFLPPPRAVVVDVVDGWRQKVCGACWLSGNDAKVDHPARQRCIADHGLDLNVPLNLCWRVGRGLFHSSHITKTDKRGAAKHHKLGKFVVLPAATAPDSGNVSAKGLFGSHSDKSRMVHYDV